MHKICTLKMMQNSHYFPFYFGNIGYPIPFFLTTPPGIKKYRRCGDVFLSPVPSKRYRIPFGNRQVADWARKQVDLANIVQSNRYGFPADTKCRGNPFDSVSFFID